MNANAFTRIDKLDALVGATAACAFASKHVPLVFVLDFPGDVIVEVTVGVNTRGPDGVALTDGYAVMPEHHSALLQVIRAMLARKGHATVGRAAPECGETTLDRRTAMVPTPRQIEIISMIAGGVTNQRIAVILDISVLTVRTHRQNLMKKLRLRNAADITGYAIKHGFYAVR
ncbi:DNA-binding CsgD family transcriptional regulator [Undibacterium sp. GrIS 1.8]|uniref:response regulator transcription factor n=1 Tax=unclassified Undibacterium TaxID=2630295 RepID=UPI003399F7D5